ncbi:ABC transporter permease [Cryomorpha ignava]|uniref:ABC transporter permease n=1 Tax=Cryomorpha ignava TaxID=101383 RepID=A0A7K3WLD4_9FLAO|nr:FtsX-like permease family protein [Cryomorpha ignava]NEN22456.1 ABC transporter permease [Cryomorpha ignava]
MNTPLFIAKRLIRKESVGKELSRPIVRIATIGIALGMAVMILAIAIVTGFQGEIREKVIGFGSHIQITQFGTASKFVDPKLEIDQAFYPSLDTVDGVKHINMFALKEGVLETKDNIQGILAKGVASDFDWTFLKSKLVEGSVLSVSDTATSNDMLISEFLAKRLQVKLGDKVPVYFQNAKSGMSQRNFTLVGIFNTGLKEMDEEFVFIDIDQIRKLSQWGIDAQMIYKGCQNGQTLLAAKGFGGNGDLRLKWSADSLRGEGPHSFCIQGDTTIYVVATDNTQTIGDTAFFNYSGVSRAAGNCHCPADNSYTISTSGGSGKYYTGGFEVQLNSYEDLDRMDQILYEHLNYDLKTSTIKQNLPEIFNWLEMLDLNTLIIVGLMILISVINMTSALLILIMERTNMIGMLKAMGAGSWFIQRIFIIQAAYIITIGLLAGNALGIGLGLLQKTFGFVKLDPENYYVSVVPVLLDPMVILGLNLATLLICVAAMLIPSLAVAQIRPTKAIRFD